MNAALLLEHYARIADAPDAIARLRRFVLDLAVRGKLVEQDARDEPASELLIQISAEKSRLARAGSVKASKRGPLTHGQVGTLPAGWIRTNLDGITACLDYMRRPINGAERNKRIDGKPIDLLFPYYGATQQQGWIDDFLFDDELVLLGEDGIPFFDPLRPKAYLISGRTWVNNHAHVFKGILISSRFLVHYLNVFDYSGRVVGSTRAKLNQAQAIEIPVDLPPLAEQHRIVAKVDELMALCDQLEAARAEREAVRDTFTLSTLAKLNTPDPETFGDDARFALTNLAPLTTRADQIKQLRQTILNLAVRGQLVEQEPREEPASDLLKKIAADRAALTAAGKLRNAKPLPKIEPDDFKGQIPAGWCLSRLGDVTKLWNGYAFKSSDFQTSGVPVVRIGDLQDGDVDLSGTACVSNQIANSLGNGFWIPEGALLLAMSGATTGKTAFNNTGRKLLLNQRVGRVEPFRVSIKFIRFFLETIIARNLSISFGTAIPNLSAQQINETLILIPPLAEQHRIVAKVNELMALCDQLEVSLTTGEQTRSRLLESVLHNALEPA